MRAQVSAAEPAPAAAITETASAAQALPSASAVAPTATTAHAQAAAAAVARTATTHAAAAVAAASGRLRLRWPRGRVFEPELLCSR